MKKISIIAIFLLLSQLTFAQQSLQWQLGYSKDYTFKPSKFIEATVPGAVQLDIAKAEKYQPYYYAENWKDYLWMEDQYYVYKTTFSKPTLTEGEQLYFISKGIDYEFDIYLNDEKLFYQEGMFSPVKLNLTEKLRAKNDLRIVVYPVPKSHAEPADRSQADRVAKPPVSYGWDWHPRLIPLGIWDETYLLKLPKANLNNVWVGYSLNENYTKASIKVTADGHNLKKQPFVWKLLDNNKKVVAEKQLTIDTDNSFVFDAVLENPKLWWPHDYGTPYRYTSVFELKDASGKTTQRIEQRVGFKKVELVMNEGGWTELTEFPKSRSVAPAQFKINGKKIFAKGSNWVNPEIFPGKITNETYRELINKAVEANFNIFRIWGGGIVNKEIFFELCDEKGILVWQEFPLACNNYPNDPHYLKILEQEAIAIVNRLKKHPSLALWSGGNELFNAWSGMTDQSHPLRLLNSVTYNLNPEIPFIPTSPIMGMAHGHYVFQDQFNGEEVYALMRRAHNTAYTEFGMPGAASVDILKKIIPQNELWPPKAGTSWESHHAFGAWMGNTWLMDDVLAGYFGPAKNLEELVAQSQWVQSEGYKAIFEGARRQKPYCAMAINWCYNEPWYTAANNSLLSYPVTPKPAFEAVKNSCRPVCASAVIEKFKWKEGDVFKTQVWMLNDLQKEVEAGKISVKLIAGNKQYHLLNWDFAALTPYQNAEGPVTQAFKLPHWDTDRFEVVVEVEGKPEYRSTYTLLYEPEIKKTLKQTPTLNQ
ncbi:MAG: hypothetical protein CR989_05300 [Flavobacteriales bacterium]|nr:MAG: hypothetical protein CR989_05300 [Flavobacteriales bacterium]